MKRPEKNASTRRSRPFIPVAAPHPTGCARHDLAAKRLPLHSPTQDAVDLPKMVQVVCRFQPDELLDRLPSPYFVDPITLLPPCARDRLQQPQIAIAQRPKD